MKSFPDIGDLMSKVSVARNSIVYERIERDLVYIKHKSEPRVDGYVKLKGSQEPYLEEP